MKKLADEVEGAMGRLTALALQAAGCRTHAEAMTVIDNVLTLARDWYHHGLPLDDIRRETTPHMRFLAGRFVRPQPVELKALLAALIDDDASSPEGYTYRTKHGTFTGSMLDAAPTRMDRHEDTVRLRFAQRQPWLVHPDDAAKRGEPGVRADPVYAEDHEERARIANDGVTAAYKQKQQKRNRWKDE